MRLDVLGGVAGRPAQELQPPGAVAQPSDLGLDAFDPEAMLKAMRADKKVDKARIRFVCLNRLGEAASGITAEDDLVREILAEA